MPDSDSDITPTTGTTTAARNCNRTSGCAARSSGEGQKPPRWPTRRVTGSYIHITTMPATAVSDTYANTPPRANGSVARMEHDVTRRTATGCTCLEVYTPCCGSARWRVHAYRACRSRCTSTADNGDSTAGPHLAASATNGNFPARTTTGCVTRGNVEGPASIAAAVLRYTCAERQVGPAAG